MLPVLRASVGIVIRPEVLDQGTDRAANLLEFFSLGTLRRLVDSSTAHVVQAMGSIVLSHATRFGSGPWR